MNPTLKAHILRYWLALNLSAGEAAVHAVTASGGIALVHESVPGGVPALTLQQVACVFLIAFGRQALAYLKANPVTALLPPEGKAT